MYKVSVIKSFVVRRHREELKKKIQLNRKETQKESQRQRRDKCHSLEINETDNVKS